ncbi:neutral zinc metallopeptidase [Aquisalinus flavus]|uniref:Flagellar biosynthesis protein FlgM n=1 Tax=Aquisalinus flavus TaxID=1526572 RepID=A0A8J2V527_9PROT|nr:neutral zinc metallopeptidase [Aquisalinus flavus]MBD0425481.1 zinc metallopeptidase [Aquisalinus flavus]UNE48886.1 hypothetical protein FF099_12905 [Aquisalinus flavus]GGD15716.1 flagellar biosynthesis protein FlgM [Aquisalinus flavus]
MRRSGRRKSSNVVNRKGEGRQSLGGLGGGGGSSVIIMLLLRLIMTRFGLAGIAILVVGFFALQAVGLNPLQMLSGGGQDYAPQQSATSQADLCESGSETEQFMCVVLASTEDVWNGEFTRRGGPYPEPELHIFAGGVSAGACGYASSAVGPFYCPATNALYLDTEFFTELSRRFGAPGDFAQAYVVAHEVGHHIQNVSGTLSQVQRAKQGLTGPGQNELQVRVELQADCLAGVWAHHENELAGLDDGDIEEALAAANAIGDDTLQRQAGQRPMPDSFTHGTSAQRMDWFKRGYDTGEMEDCDTFATDAL